MRWLVLLLLLPGCVQSEPEPVRGDILGSFVDQMACPYGNATVNLPALHLYDVSTELGGFLFRNLPLGRYEITAFVPGVGSVSENVTLVDDQAQFFLVLPRQPSPCQESSNGTSRSSTDLRGFGELLLPGDDCEPCGWKVPIATDVHAVHLRISWEGDATELHLTLRQGNKTFSWLGGNPTSQFLYVSDADLSLHVQLPAQQLPQVHLLVETKLSFDRHV